MDNPVVRAGTVRGIRSAANVDRSWSVDDMAAAHRPLTRYQPVFLHWPLIDWLRRKEVLPTLDSSGWVVKHAKRDGGLASELGRTKRLRIRVIQFSVWKGVC